MNKYFVYCLLDPRKIGIFQFDNYKFEYEPFYIGKGSGRRPEQHCSSSQLKREKNRKKANKILKIKKEGYEPIKIIIYNNLEEDLSLFLEKKLIKIIGRSDLNEGPLTNLTNGGEKYRCKFHDLSPIVQEKIRLQRKIYMINNNPMKDKNISRKNGEMRKGTKHTEEYKKNMSEKIKNSEKHKLSTQSEKNRKTHKEIQKKNMKPILQYDRNMNFINEYESIAEASRQLNIRKTDITSVLHKRQKSAKGFVFLFKNK